VVLFSDIESDKRALYHTNNDVYYFKIALYFKLMILNHVMYM